MSCDKINLRCQEPKQSSKCISYEGDLPDFSELEQPCTDMEQVEEEQYNLIKEIRENTDVSQLTSDCITYPTERTVLNVLQAMQDKICEMEGLIESLQQTVATQQEEIEDLQQNICP